MAVWLWWRRAGLVSVSVGRWNVHLFPSRACWEWGHSTSWYDGPLHSWGAGPLLLVCWQEE